MISIRIQPHLQDKCKNEHLVGIHQNKEREREREVAEVCVMRCQVCVGLSVEHP